jgi:hypothetical protein
MQSMFYATLDAKVPVQNLIKAFDYTKVKHLLDVCGGDASNAVEIAKAYPHLKITVADLPTTCDKALKRIAENGLSDRVGVHPFDVNADDPHPFQYDAVSYMHCLPIWDYNGVKRIVSRHHKSLQSGGYHLIYNVAANADDTGPLFASLFAVYLLNLACTDGTIYQMKEYENVLREIGCSDVKGSEEGLVGGRVLVVGRKT